MTTSDPRRTLLSPGSWPEAQRLARLLRDETIGGILLLIAAVAAVTWANSPAADSYFAFRDLRIGPAALHLDLTMAQWAADGLLAVFFFVAGLELKREFVVGDLREIRRAALPVAAAIGGMAVPALLYTAINLGTVDGSLNGWAIPTATDIAFSLAVLAVVSTHLPTALRTFLLTLAIVDDLLAIVVIALFYAGDLNLVWLMLAAVPLAAFTVLVQLRITSAWLLLPLALITWVFVHNSGIHATVAGVLLGFAVPVKAGRFRKLSPANRLAGPGLADRFEHLWRPVSAGFAVPVFALLASGVAIGGLAALGESLTERVTVAIIVAMVVGKTAGIMAATRLISWLTKTPLASGLRWLDVLGLSLLGGLGFTVSLLIGELAFDADSVYETDVKIGVLAGSIIAAILAAIVLRMRNRTYRQIEEEQARDSDADGIPDCYQTLQSESD